ncbi:MAG: hypothetical protein M1830_003671 [Pleopsidium flavum]|nr:MAG: hypothetical protein M1830_003671 [Pleopsidium flavum]
MTALRRSPPLLHPNHPFWQTYKPSTTRSQTRSQYNRERIVVDGGGPNKPASTKAAETANTGKKITPIPTSKNKITKPTAKSKYKTPPTTKPTKATSNTEKKKKGVGDKEDRREIGKKDADAVVRVQDQESNSCDKDRDSDSWKGRKKGTRAGRRKEAKT